MTFTGVGVDDAVRCPAVVVMMSTFNGSAFLEDQVRSILAQTGVRPLLHVRDDGSCDGTRDTLAKWARHGDVTVTAGQNLGIARSFHELLLSVPDADFYAFSDQDDVWDQDKLATAVRSVKTCNPTAPCVYYSSTRLVDAQLEPLQGGRPASDGPPRFAQALAWNYASGCTMVFNRAMLDAVRRRPSARFTIHDSWIIKVCLALGGRVIFDPLPHISYRQHDSNAIGATYLLRERARRWCAMLSAPKRDRSDDAKSLLKNYQHEMDPEFIALAQTLAVYKDGPLSTLRLLRQKQFRHSTALGNASFLGAAILHLL